MALTHCLASFTLYHGISLQIFIHIYFVVSGCVIKMSPHDKAFLNRHNKAYLFTNAHTLIHLWPLSVLWLKLMTQIFPIIEETKPVTNSHHILAIGGK